VPKTLVLQDSHTPAGAGAGPSHALLAETLAGQYALVGKIGEGGMATVYLATQTSLKRPVAVKVLAHNLAQHAAVSAHFERESLIIARLNHPNIIHIIDRGMAGGFPYFVMEYVEGTTLAKRLPELRREPYRRLDIVLQLCKALAYAHKNGVIHRDVKPANVLLDKEGNVRVADFGIAQMLNADEAAAPGRSLVVGTPGYMAPEQHAAAPLTAAADLYALGVIMYEMFTGHMPGRQPVAPSALDPMVPRRLDEIILQCLARDPGERPASADALRAALLDLLKGAHLGAAQKQRALAGITTAQEKSALLDVIKETRFGAVYLFEHKPTRQLLIIKKVRRKKDGLREAQLLASLKHPHVAAIHGVSSDRDTFIIVMEYLAGGTLKERLARSLPWRDALAIARQIAEALAFAHRNRVVHGNLRPSNVLFAGDGSVRVADFGLDEHYADDAEAGNWYALAGEEKSKAVDIYALGVLLHEMLTGERPEWKDGAPQLAASLRLLPAGFKPLLLKMLARKPAERHAVVEEILAAFESLLAPPSKPVAAKQKKSGFWGLFGS
jgi:serine/threonine-protein kinase